MRITIGFAEFFSQCFACKFFGGDVSVARSAEKKLPAHNLSYITIMMITATVRSYPIYRDVVWYCCVLGNLSDVFESFRAYSSAFERAQTRSDEFGCIWDAFNNFLTCLETIVKNRLFQVCLFRSSFWRVWDTLQLRSSLLGTD